MLHTEYVRSLNSNYERVLLPEKPEERKYQYCIINRGGIKGLLPCTLRYINCDAFLYYDITSKHAITQLFSKRVIDRAWLKDFVWSISQITNELDRFLLDIQNIVWHPQQIYQDLEENIFYYIYIPYYDGTDDFLSLLEFVIEHVDYDDTPLVECVYKMYEQCEKSMGDYLQGQIHRDIQMLDKESIYTVTPIDKSRQADTPNNAPASPHLAEEASTDIFDREQASLPEEEVPLLKKGLFARIENRKQRQRKKREDHRILQTQTLAGKPAVAETSYYEDPELGETIYIEEEVEEKEHVFGLFSSEGERISLITSADFAIGKRKEECDLVLEDISVSRLHARILTDGGRMYLEDLNSTNGTYKNGLRLLPYERRLLEAEDEIRLGKRTLIFR